MESKRRAFLLGLGAFLLALAAWEGASRAGFYSPHLFPPPSRAFAALAVMARSGELWGDFKASALRWTLGILLGALIGVPLGLATGSSRSAHDSVGQVLNFLRTIPFVVVIPLAMLWFGFKDQEKVFMVAWGALFPIWLNTQAGAQSMKREYLWAARSLGVAGPRLFLEVFLPYCLPFIIAGARIAIATSTFALTAAEMAGAFEGLGHRVFYSYQMFQTDKMMAGIVVLGLLCFTADRLFLWTVHRLMPWYQETQEADV